MFKPIAMTAFVILVAACSNKISEAEEAVAYDLIDPDSAKFRETRVTEDGTVCGQVNGKNRMGAYVGFNDFFARDIGGEWFVTIVNPQDEILGDLYRRQFLENCDPEGLESLNDLEAMADEIDLEAGDAAAAAAAGE